MVELTTLLFLLCLHFYVLRQRMSIDHASTALLELTDSYAQRQTGRLTDRQGISLPFSVGMKDGRRSGTTGELGLEEHTQINNTNTHKLV